MLESVPEINQYWAIKVKFLAQANNGSICFSEVDLILRWFKHSLFFFQWYVY